MVDTKHKTAAFLKKVLQRNLASMRRVGIFECFMFQVNFDEIGYLKFVYTTIIFDKDVKSRKIKSDFI